MTIALVLQSNTSAQLKLQHYTYKLKKHYTRTNITNHRNDSKYIGLHVSKIAVKKLTQLNNKNVARLFTQSKIK